MEKHCQIEFNENSLNIKGLETSSITIDTIGDIDVTSLVERLIQLIDTEDKIVFDTVEDSKWDDKKKLIYKLVRKIVEKYNACLNEDVSGTEAISSMELDQDDNADYSGYVVQGDDVDNLPF